MEGSLIQNMLFYRKRISETREAIYDYDTGKRYTYGELYRRANRLARFLVEECHLQKGDCIAFFSANHPSFFESFFATFYTGIIVSVYNYRLREQELLSLIRKEQPKILFYENDFIDKIKVFRKETDIKYYITLSDASQNGDMTYEHLLDRPDREPLESPVSQEDIQLYLHTGGTTGTPKTAKLSYRCIFYNCVCDVMTNALTMEDCEYVFLPLFHTSAWNIITLPLLMCGGRIILTRHFHTETALKIIAEERPTLGMAVPFIYKALAEHPDFEKTDVSCFRWLSSGGATTQKNVMEPWWNRGVPIANGYGMTEVGPHNMVVPMVGTSVDLLREKWNSIGIPMYFNQVRIVDEFGQDVEDGIVGELLFKGPLIFSGYLKDPEETASAVQNGWVYTGDMAWRDRDGYYYIAGRKKHMFISGGENIYSTEIETVLGAYPAVKDVCVIGVKDPRWGEVGKAILVVDPDRYSEEELRAFAANNLSTIKVPKYYEVTDHIPVNSAGKRDMVKIHQMFGDLFDAENQA